MPHRHQGDLDAIAGLSTVPTILDVVCRTTGMRFAAIVRVTDERWLACAVHDELRLGLKAGSELEVGTTICDEVRRTRNAIVIDDVDRSAYGGHPAPAMYGFRSFISMPIIYDDGSFFGTLMAFDPNPREVGTTAIVDMFKMFADVVAGHLDSIGWLAESAASLKTERGDAELREQFIAVLGHDLRNPLANIRAGTELLRKRGVEAARYDEIVRLMVGSIDRMSVLIDNVLDFARGRLGGGLGIDYVKGPLKPTLLQVLDELRSTDADRRFDAAFDFVDQVTCDPARIGQLFSNLVGNAMTHGAKNTPITIRASDADGMFMLSVANHGKPIPDAARLKLFEPFFRVNLAPTKQGLGLGLYISAQIARAHGGELTVTSDETETRFVLRFPLAQAVQEDAQARA